MSPFAMVAAALTRVASLTSIIRTRSEDAARFEVHGGTVEDVKARTAETAVQFEAAAAALEAQV